MIGLVMFFLVYVIGTSVLCYALGAYTLMKLWTWIISPTFHIDPISFFAAMGIIMVFRFLTAKAAKQEKIDNIDDVNEAIGRVSNHTIVYVLFCCFTLLFGYAIKGFI